MRVSFGGDVAIGPMNPHFGAAMTHPADWHKSSYSGDSPNCMEVREDASGTDVRDTKNREAGHLSFGPSEWAAILAAAK